MQETNKELQVCCQCNIEKECAPIKRRMETPEEEWEIIGWMCEECAEGVFGGESDEPADPNTPDIF